MAGYWSDDQKFVVRRLPFNMPALSIEPGLGIGTIGVHNNVMMS